MLLDINYFYSLTPRQFSNILDGHRQKEEGVYRTSWEQTRQLMYASLLPHQKTDKKGKVITPLKLKDVLYLPWDNENTSTAPNKEKLEASKQFWERIDKKRDLEQ